MSLSNTLSLSLTYTSYFNLYRTLTYYLPLYLYQTHFDFVSLSDTNLLNLCLPYFLILKLDLPILSLSHHILF